MSPSLAKFRNRQAGMTPLLYRNFTVSLPIFAFNRQGPCGRLQRTMQRRPYVLPVFTGFRYSRVVKSEKPNIQHSTLNNNGLGHVGSQLFNNSTCSAVWLMLRPGTGALRFARATQSVLRFVLSKNHAHGKFEFSRRVNGRIIAQVFDVGTHKLTYQIEGHE